MKILLHGINYTPEQVGIAVYTASMAEDLVQRGHEVRVVAGRPYYPLWKQMDGQGRLVAYRTVESGVSVLRVPHYVPRNPRAAKRLLHHASFALTSFFPMLWQALTWRPDVVIGIAPALVAAPVARMAAFLARAHAWLHVQDFEVEAAVATGLVRATGFWAGLALRVEAAMLRSFDTVSTISGPMCRRLAAKGVANERIVEFRNAADIGSIEPIATVSRFREMWSITTPHVALYSGTIGAKQGIEIIADAARLLAGREDLTFVVCGEGAGLPALQSAVVDLPNVRLFGLQSKEHLGELLGLASVHLLPQLAGAADLVLPSKLGNMLASGRPVVATAADGTGIADEVADCGIATAPGDAGAFAAAIAAFLDDPERRSQFGRAARLWAEARWSRPAIIADFERQVLARTSRGSVHVSASIVEASET